MIEILKKAKNVKTISYAINFLFHDSAGGFSFECDKNGIPFLENDLLMQNWKSCLDGTFDVELEGLHTYTNIYMEPAVGKCCCGEELILAGEYHGTSKCECGRWYNISGVELNPPSMW